MSGNRRARAVSSISMSSPCAWEFRGVNRTNAAQRSIPATAAIIIRLGKIFMAQNYTCSVRSIEMRGHAFRIYTHRANYSARKTRGSMERACPDDSSTSMRTACIWTSLSATSKRAGSPFRKRSMMPSLPIPIIESCGPVMPTSVMKAVPLGNTWASAVATCVCVPTTAETLPSEPAHGLFFGSRLSVHVHQNHFHFRRHAGQFALRGAKGTVERGHERAPLQVQHRVADSATRRANVKPAPWRARRKVRRTQQARLMRQVIEDFLAVPDVISAGKHFRARGEKIVGQPWRDAKTRSGVFAIDDGEIDLLLRDDIREMVVHDAPAGRAYDVSYKKNSHELEVGC